MSTINALKTKIREEVWNTLDVNRVASPRPSKGKIPTFAGARTAALKLVKRDLFKGAEVVFSTPDSSLQPIREETLKTGKTLVMITPNLSGFVIVDGGSIPNYRITIAATPRGALTFGQRVKVPENVKVDLILVGSVAVDRLGGRLGRGDGQQDIEYAVLRELKLISDQTPVVTAIHDLQIVSRVPMLYHDLPVDYIITPTLFLKIQDGYKKPSGIIWDVVNAETIEKLPLLKILYGSV
ncbi:MAG: 5-formyltetrahydrofolate cyclo-ligase [Thermofilaceae archaeon]